MSSIFAKCHTCGTVLNEDYIGSQCPFCHTEMDHKNYDNGNIITESFNIPKINNPLDILANDIDFSTNIEPIQNPYKNNKVHYLNIIQIYKLVDIGKKVTIKVCLTWDFQFKNDIYGIFENVREPNTFYLQKTSLENIAQLFENEHLDVNIRSIKTDRESYFRFNEFVGNVSNTIKNLNSLFNLYNSVDWSINDKFEERKTFYEYACTNYLFHVFNSTGIADVGLNSNPDNSLIPLKTLFKNCSEFYVGSPLSSFIKRIDEYDSYLEYRKDKEKLVIENYEDVFDFFCGIDEGAVAPVSIPLSPVCQRSARVYNKLYDLGYNPNLNIYSVKDKVSLCPTFEKNESVYYIECNDNIMKGINEFESIEDMKSILNEVYNENNLANLFIEIKHVPSSTISYLLTNSNSDKEFLDSIIKIKDKYDPDLKNDYVYENDIYSDEPDESDDSIIVHKQEIEDNKKILSEALNPSKRKEVENLIYKVFNIIDKTGSNTKKYKELFNKMSDTKFLDYFKDLCKDKNKNFYLEVLPNKNAPTIQQAKEALDALKVPAEEFVYYRHDGHKDNPIRTRYKVPVVYISLRRLQQSLSKKNTYSLDINKRNMKTGTVTGDDKIA